MPRWFWHPQRPKTSADVFQVEQQLWGILAGDRAPYWCKRAAEPRSPESGAAPLYTSLEKERKEVRLLRVSRLARSAPEEAGFVGQLVHAALEDNPTYVAVSYARDDPSAVGHFVDSDGVETALGYNQAVLDIVSTLVPPGDTLYLWIDAVCINQEDPDERASQVEIMGEIYSTAQQVIVFLGTADDASTRAMDLLQLTRGLMQASGDVLLTRGLEDFEKRSLGAGIPPASWADVAQLLCRPWFTRRWVVQEVALARDVTVVCGRHAARWDELCRLCGWIADNSGILLRVMEKHRTNPNRGQRLGRVEAPFRNPGRIMAARDLRDGAKDPAVLQQLLLRFRNFQAADPRDRIFSLLGLALPADQVDPDLRPNYRISVEDLYIQVASRILRRDADPLILSVAGVGHRRSLDLPSWVPDWTSLAGGTSLAEIAAAGNYQATDQGTRPSISYDPKLPKVLSITGSVVDTISKVSYGRPPLGPGGRMEYVGDTLDWIDGVLETAGLGSLPSNEKQPQSNPEEAAQRTALWRTLTASGPAVSPQKQQQQQQQREGPPTERGFERWLEERRACDASDSLEVLRLGRAEREEVSRFAYHCERATRARQVFVSAAGHLGLAAPGARVGDAICVFPGVRTPMAVRRAGGHGGGSDALGAGAYVLVGEVYHHGIVSGATRSFLPGKPFRIV
ncbi:hypothetical protein KVR01_004138 [Diaporthe batatas]|uniref:uncharacterized protein n=1 Tax=Diaporthe batatas TaxID=748121 RepID=UPI001D04134C|nr:uncharacterized protein KVR01_004138 [Diaporthe batatas]KAG8165586.1 hypothetical protein KVR01_004138 [Diaporthe batatas]